MKTNKLTLAMGILLAGAAIGPAAFAQTTPMPSQNNTNQQAMQQNMKNQFQKMDTNHDGHVSKSEFDHYWKNQFTTADTNHDGKLSKQECLAAVKEMNGTVAVNRGRFDQMWQQMASNGNHTADNISEHAFVGYHNKMFKHADMNNNKKLSMTEARDAMHMHNANVAML